MLKINFYPDSDLKDFSKAVKEYEDIWEKGSMEILDAISKVSGLNFRESFFNALVYDGMSFAYPLRLRYSYSYNDKVRMLIHELGHRLLIANVSGHLRLQVFEQHKQLNLMLFDVWDEFSGKRFAKQGVSFEARLSKVYRKAWEWALSFSKEKRAKKFKDLVEGKTSPGEV